MSEIHALLQQASQQATNYLDLSAKFSYARLIVPLVTGFPGIAFLIWTYLSDEIYTYLTTGQLSGLLLWTGSDSAYLT